MEGSFGRIVDPPIKDEKAKELIEELEDYKKGFIVDLHCRCMPEESIYPRQLVPWERKEFTVVSKNKYRKLIRSHERKCRVAKACSIIKRKKKKEKKEKRCQFLLLSQSATYCV